MGTRYRPKSKLLTLWICVCSIICLSCVSRNHVPAGQDIRKELLKEYFVNPESFQAEYADGHPLNGRGNPLHLLLMKMGMNLDNAFVRFSYLQIRTQYLGLYQLRPRADSPARGTVFFLHGYMNHPGTYSDLYNFLLDAGYSVVTVDLPGHGVSSGERGVVASFDEYAELVAQILAWADGRNLPLPWFGAGHSTGAAAILMHAAANPDTPLNSLFLASPLGRTRLYRLSIFGEQISGRFVYGVKAAWEDDFSVNHVPLSWVRGLREWVSGHQQFPLVELPVFTAWGGADDTLDMKYSRGFYQRVCLQLYQHYFPDGIHNLFHYGPVQQELFGQMLNFFDLHSRP